MGKEQSIPTLASGRPLVGHKRSGALCMQPAAPGAADYKIV